MTPIEWIVAVPLALAWLYLAVARGFFWRIAPFLPKETPALEAWPSVCAIVPARNEAWAISQTLVELLRQDYPGKFQIILVDDQSDDGTADRAREALKASHSKVPLQVLQAQTLEPGWVGKLWALEQGLRATKDSRPDYYLFTDADIVHPRESLRQLVARAQTGSCDLVSLMAKLRCQSFWEALLIPAFVFFFQKLYPFAWVNDPRSKTAGAAGGCILIRSSALERIGGLSPIRAQLIDDCSLARLVKDSGGNLWLGLTESVKSLRTYDDLGSIWKMVSRTAFTQLRYSNALLLGTLVGMLWIYIWAPVLTAMGFLTGDPARLIAGLSICLLMAALYFPMVRFYRVSCAYAFALPAIAALYSAMTFHSAWLHWTGSGGQWKGRSYAPVDGSSSKIVK